MRDLSEIRVDIDIIDKQILELFEKRMELTTQVAEYKISVGKPVLDRERELQKLETLTAMAESEDNREPIRELFEQIMAISRKKQNEMME